MKWKHSERYGLGNTIAIIENRFKQYRSHRRAERTRPVAVHAVVVLHVFAARVPDGGVEMWRM
jgi:hypothetical protein